MHPASFTGLYRSIRGEVACADHAPDVGDPDGQSRDGLRCLSRQDLFRGPEYQCQHCATDGRALVHDPGGLAH